jgi:D-sedoheptulose 7-phosphate isomerase
VEELDDPLQSTFANHVDTVYRALDLLHPALQRAVDICSAVMLSERKVLACGNGLASAIGQAFCASMLNSSRLERPGLPALSLGSDATVLSAIAEAQSFGDIFSRQIQAIGQPGDALIVISSVVSSSSIVQAIRAAHAREMQVIALTGGNGGDAALLLEAEDLELRIPSEDAARVLECQLLILNSISAMLEARLFGAG